MEEKFIEIFNLYKNDIYRLTFSYTKNVSDSDDIVQNVFVKLFQHQELFNKELVEVKKWLIRVTINECKNLLLSSWKKKIIPKNEEYEKLNFALIHSNSILSEVLELPKKYRIVVYLYYYEEYKIKEIATLLKISETNVQTRLSRAREKLKNILEGDGYEK